jgi:hypothetical protein
MTRRWPNQPVYGPPKFVDRFLGVLTVFLSIGLIIAGAYVAINAVAQFGS